MAQNEDRRVRRTKKAMTDALAELMSEKPLGSISVREIAEKADINRGTFYLYYRDVYDMAAQLQRGIFEKFNGIVEQHEHGASSDELFPLLVKLLNLLSDNASLVKVLIGKNGDAAFADTLKKTIRDKCCADAANILGIKQSGGSDYFYEYMISGCIGIFTEWLSTGMKESAADMARLCENLIQHGASALK